jgi:hypothetical protein
MNGFFDYLEQETGFTANQYIKVYDPYKTDTVKVQINDLISKYTYKVFTALLSQTGTDDPVVTMLENTLGETPVVSRVGIGEYMLEVTTPIFTEGKTFVVLSNISFDVNSTMYAYRGTHTSVHIESYEAGGVFKDGIPNNTPLEIRIYP